MKEFTTEELQRISRALMAYAFAVEKQEHCAEADRVAEAGNARTLATSVIASLSR
jgi:hypothetical protein